MQFLTSSTIMWNACQPCLLCIFIFDTYFWEENWFWKWRKAFIMVRIFCPEHHKMIPEETKWQKDVTFSIKFPRRTSQKCWDYSKNPWWQQNLHIHITEQAITKMDEVLCFYHGKWWSQLFDNPKYPLSVYHSSIDCHHGTFARYGPICPNGPYRVGIYK